MLCMMFTKVRTCMIEMVIDYDETGIIGRLMC